MISKKIISIVASAMIFCFMVCTSVTGVKADDSEVKVVDGSYLTSADSSTGYTPKSDERGEHLMDGECSITKAGTKRIYTYGATTANHTVDALAVIVYVDQYFTGHIKVVQQGDCTVITVNRHVPHIGT